MESIVKEGIYECLRWNKMVLESDGAGSGAIAGCRKKIRIVTPIRSWFCVQVERHGPTLLANPAELFRNSSVPQLASTDLFQNGSNRRR